MASAGGAAAGAQGAAAGGQEGGEAGAAAADAALVAAAGVGESRAAYNFEYLDHTADVQVRLGAPRVRDVRAQGTVSQVMCDPSRRGTWSSTRHARPAARVAAHSRRTLNQHVKTTQLTCRPTGGMRRDTPS